MRQYRVTVELLDARPGAETSISVYAKDEQDAAKKAVELVARDFPGLGTIASVLDVKAAESATLQESREREQYIVLVKRDETWEDEGETFPTKEHARAYARRIPGLPTVMIMPI
jgi:hypothetical protein